MPVYWYLYIWRRDKEPLLMSNERRALSGAEASGWGATTRTADEREKEYVPPPQPPDWR
jgi:hypothetical protein